MCTRDLGICKNSPAVVKSEGLKAGECQVEESEHNALEWTSSLHDDPISVMPKIPLWG